MENLISVFVCYLIALVVVLFLWKDKRKPIEIFRDIVFTTAEVISGLRKAGRNLTKYQILLIIILQIIELFFIEIELFNIYGVSTW